MIHAAWERRPQHELVDYIILRYHEGLRLDLPPLIATARTLDRALADELDAFWAEMQSHMAKEEQVLFPMLHRGLHGPQVYMPVRIMEAEHGNHTEHLARIRALTDDLSIPARACATRTALYRGLRQMEADMLEHIHLENDVLFARANAS